MKLITTINGTSVLRTSLDDFSPPNGMPVSEMSKWIADTYKCQPFSLPQVSAGLPMPNPPVGWFQNGQFHTPSAKVAISHLVIFQNGLWITTASTTDNSDAVLDHLIANLDKEFGFKIATIPETKKKRFVVSGIVVEFEKQVEKLSRDLDAICQILNGTIRRPDAVQLQFRNLGFAYDGHDAPQATFETIEWTNFVIERRTQTPYSENRFFSSAPLNTIEHTELLEKIEKVLARPET